ncbi:hypothetical protein PRIPAC_90814 [Pristionchus pacificus]|uniref:Uncharacterized protein n=1 Tax=Pristionchus pacificus TaxID=54126 RepID=A0A2A6CX55_PRIPA|nr:hypothetical protein PRIPAC_90814 [Pristionchus pacificus]|eukprot:PDM82802.1 hypothetical protein PRIPAC_37195 [Pristionchus pacificus]
MRVANRAGIVSRETRGPSWHRPSRKARGASGDPKKRWDGATLRGTIPSFFRLALGPTSLRPETRRGGGLDGLRAFSYDDDSGQLATGKAKYKH